MSLFPLQSFQHTLREISVNRANPCELVRELVSNSYDAGASEILVAPLSQKKGLLFFDNGEGLSTAEKDSKRGVLPYVAFFSIGKGTKTAGQQIGYKCQGSKLCFASRRFSVITRCSGESAWQWKTIDNPKQTLNESFDLTPTHTTEPWKILRQSILPDADERTTSILDTLTEEFFISKFSQGTMIIIEEFETDSYESYFSVDAPNRNYLYNYIRFYTIHGDVRRISKEQGFSPRDVKAVRANLKPDRTCELKFWVGHNNTSAHFESIPQGWQYLVPPTEKTESPAVVHQLKNGRFFARHATTFRYADRYYSIILAIDGNRRAQERYEQLGRHGSRKSGIKLSDLRGALLSSNGIIVCQYRQLWDHDTLEDWRILQDGPEHYVLIIDGPFELVTNRDALAPSSLGILRDQEFTKQIKNFLQGVAISKEGDVLAQLVSRLNRETTRHEENRYIDNNNKLRQELKERESFLLKAVPNLRQSRFFSPEPGEEHFVGALYTLFSHLVPANHPLIGYWSRPLTFASRGIDAIAVENDNKAYTNGNLISIEYKYWFSAGDEFNHPLNVTDKIICWNLTELSKGSSVRDSYGYQGSVKTSINHENRSLGFIISDIRNVHEQRDFPHEVQVLSLKSMLNATFDVVFQPGTNQSKPTPKGKRR